MATLIVGCGYLGRRVGRLLVSQGESVFGTVRSTASAENLTALGVRPVLADVLNPSDWEQLPGVDRVFYSVGFDRSAGVPMRTVYVEGLSRVLAALPPSVERLVYASATSVYGVNDGGWVTEETPTAPVTDSGRVCLEAEQALARSGVPFVIVRYSGLYGPGRVVRRAALERGEAMAGDPARWLNLIHIDDAAAAGVASLGVRGPDRVYLASDDRPVTRGEYYERAARLLGVSAPRFEPAPPGSPAAAREEASKRVSNRRIKAELGLRWAYPEITTGLPAALAGDSG